MVNEKVSGCANALPAPLPYWFLAVFTLLETVTVNTVSAEAGPKPDVPSLHVGMRLMVLLSEFHEIEGRQAAEAAVMPGLGGVGLIEIRPAVAEISIVSEKVAEIVEFPHEPEIDLSLGDTLIKPRFMDIFTGTTIALLVNSSPLVVIPDTVMVIHPDAVTP